MKIILLITLPLIFSPEFFQVLDQNQYKVNLYEKKNSRSEIPNNSEPEHYSWNLGTPDNLPEIEIIYDKDE